MTSASAFVRKRDDESDFRRLLDDATATAELSRLQDHAIRFGVPAALRAPAWRLLLALGGASLSLFIISIFCITFVASQIVSKPTDRVHSHEHHTRSLVEYMHSSKLPQTRTTGSW